MPDIKMCTNDACPLKESCYRFNAKPKEFGQSYQIFDFESSTFDEKPFTVSCAYYIPLYIHKPKQ